MNFKKQALSRNEMKAVSGGNLVAVTCSLCMEDVYWIPYRASNPYCVPYHCLIPPPTTPNPVPPDLPVPPPCPVGTPGC